MTGINYPLVIQLEIKDREDEWTSVVCFLVKNKYQLNDKIRLIRSNYALNLEYQIVIIVPSKVNDLV